MSVLFTHGEINGLSLANRIVRSATWDGMATEDGKCTPKLINLMAMLADGGVGLIVTGHAYVHPQGKHSPWQLALDRDDLLPGLREMTRTVHERGGKIAAQLGYGGAYLSKSRVGRMSVREIGAIARAFAEAAARAEKAGFDGAQIFAAHGFFLSQLLCPRYNDRTDAYGGGLANRARALLEVLRSIRKEVGRGYPVLAKLNTTDLVENGLTLDESLQVGTMLEEEGIDAIELSGGLLNNPGLLREKTRSGEKEAYFREEAAAFKKRLRVPLILVGGIRSYHTAEWLIGEGVTDYVSMCRPFICEPGLVNRWKAGDLRKAACISCNNCVEQVKQGKGVSCIPLAKATAETFFPELSETLPASPPHPPGTGYRISIGIEAWEGGVYAPVVKVQMESGGKALDQASSFPLGSDDHLRVSLAVTALTEKHAALHSKG